MVDGRRATALTILTAILGLSAPAHASAPPFDADVVTMRVDAGHDGSAPDGGARRASLSGDGGKVAFVSLAGNLVPDDTNGAADVFVHDFDDASTRLVSVATDGTQGDDDSGSPVLQSGVPAAISADGSTVVFESDATNLVTGDTNGTTDVFVHDVASGTTDRVSVSSDSAEANGASRSVAISNDGGIVAFLSSATTLAADAPFSGLYVHDLDSGMTDLVSLSNTGEPVVAEGIASLSGDGRHVAFESADPATANDTNGQYDVFERNLATGVTRLVSVTSSGAQLVGNDPDEFFPQGAALSFNGRYVAFASDANNMPPPNEPNDGTDVFVHDRKTGTTSQASVSTSGGSGSYAEYPTMSDDGRFVGFRSSAVLAPCGTNAYNTGFSGLYVRDVVEGATIRVSTTDGGVAVPTSSFSGSRLDLSADGRVAAFTSDLPLTPDDDDDLPNVFVHDVPAPIGAPDAAIALGDGRLVGAGNCHPGTAFQTKWATVGPGTTIWFRLRLENLSTFPDAIVLDGDPGATGFAVSYFRGDRDVTEAVLAGTQRTRVLGAGETATYRLRIRVRGSAVPGDHLRVLVHAASDLRPAVSDVVRAVVSVD